jgi:hypothetical protein
MKKVNKLLLMLAIMLASVTAQAEVSLSFKEHCYQQEAPENPIVASDCAIYMATEMSSTGIPAKLVWMSMAFWNPYSTDDDKYLSWELYTSDILEQSLKNQARDGP